MTHRTHMPTMRRFKIPGSMIRTNKPTVGANCTIKPSDLGVVVNNAGVVVTLPLIQPSMQGEVYTVKNVSAGEITVSTSAPNTISTSGGSINSVVIRPDESFDFDIETTNETWVIR